MCDDCACAGLGTRDDCGVERAEDERAFVGKFVTSSMSMSSEEWVAACAGPPRAKSPDRFIKYCFDASLAWVVRGIKIEGVFWVNDGVNESARETDVSPPAYDASRRRAMMCVLG